MIVVASHQRSIRLDTPAPDDSEDLHLGVHPGTSSRQVLTWARELLPPAAAAELEERMRLAGDDLGEDSRDHTG